MPCRDCAVVESFVDVQPAQGVAVEFDVGQRAAGVRVAPRDLVPVQGPGDSGGAAAEALGDLVQGELLDLVELAELLDGDGGQDVGAGRLPAGAQLDAGREQTGADLIDGAVGAGRDLGEREVLLDVQLAQLLEVGAGGAATAARLDPGGV